jgi:hypothetical protein
MLNNLCQWLRGMMALSAGELFTVNSAILCNVVQVIKLNRTEFGFLRQRVHILWFFSILRCVAKLADGAATE